MVGRSSGATRGRMSAATAVAALLLGGTQAGAQEIKLTRSAAAGADVVLVDERSWDAACNPLATSIKITTRPANGTVKVVPGTSIIAVSMPQSAEPSCAGRSITGSQLVYRPNPGFHGADTVAYKVRSGNGKRGTTSVTIRVE